MGYAKLTPIFSSVTEIRMGSPFHFAELELAGNWIPELPGYDWQDLFAESPNGRYLALVAWMIENNDPGFRFVVIDKKEKVVRESERIAGCCESLKWHVGLSYQTADHFREKEIQTWTAIVQKK